MPAPDVIDYFCDDLRLRAGLDDDEAARRVLAAFRSVPREDFAGPGPWHIHSALAPLAPPKPTPDADPRWLYHDMLVVLDREKGINIGQPALWARLLSVADVPRGGRILQVGTGVGYYTAILAALVGPDGAVQAYEVEKDLADRARDLLAAYPQTQVIHSDAARADLDQRFDRIIAFAGVTHIPEIWANALAPGGTLLLPLTGTNHWGAMILAQADGGGGFTARTIGRCGFYPCQSARDPDQETAIDTLFSKPERLNQWRFRITEPGPKARFEPMA
ncbi:MAG: methyltransferase domain-containing protein [Pseudomonadota bacterium]